MKFRYILPFVAVLLGIISLIEGGGYIFGLSHEQMISERIIPLILYFNFLTAPVYITTAILAFRQSRLAATFSAWLSLGIVLAVAYMVVFILGDGAFMARTVAGMAFRLLFWLGFSLWARRMP